MTAPLLRRRGAALALMGLAAARPAAAQAEVTILVPGPEDGAYARWAGRAAGALGRGFGRAVGLRLSTLGGPDGVTAANRFATLDGAEPRLLALPGITAHARFAGSSRTRFEPGSWVPLIASWTEAVLAGRGPAPRPGTAPLRVAFPAPDAAEAAALAALDLLGVASRPVMGPAEASFAAGESDALILTGPDLAARARRLGATPWYRLSPIAEGEGMEVPVLPAPNGAAQAVLAAAAALQLRAALVMPPLTPADTVASWRRAALRWQEEERTQLAEGQGAGMLLGHPLVGAEAAAAYAHVTPSADVALAYRSWLAQRLNWRPS